MSQGISWDRAQGAGASRASATSQGWDWGEKGCARAAPLPHPCPLGARGLVPGTVPSCRVVLLDGTVARRGPAKPGSTGRSCGAGSQGGSGGRGSPAPWDRHRATGAGSTCSGGSSTGSPRLPASRCRQPGERALRRGQKPRARQPCKCRRVGLPRPACRRARGPVCPPEQGPSGSTTPGWPRTPELAHPGASLQTSPKSVRSQAAGAPSPPPPAARSGV